MNFGEPVSLTEWIAKEHGDTKDLPSLQDVEPLANDLMNRIGNITPILPVALVATIFARAPHNKLNELALKSEVFNLLQQLEAAGFRAYIPRADRDYAVTVGVRMLTLRHILHDKDGEFSVNQEELPLLEYYANSIKHLVEQLETVA